jgi:hypothetical protein
VAYHEQFWVVVGTATPVIALSAAVALLDQSRVTIRYIVADIEEDKFTGMVALWGGQVLGNANVFLQGLVLLFAVLSLAAGHDWVPLIVAEIALPLGIWMLLGVGASSLSLRYLMSQDRLPPLAPRPVPHRPAARPRRPGASPRRGGNRGL